ncbi:MAG: S41 family peptidase [Flavobacteriales bacterium]|jgi:hypothetical protein|nr:S41 family peptidase [Flavobacteriales bacterium]
MKLLTLLGFLGTGLLANGQYTEPVRHYYPELLREDLAVLWKTVEQSHPDPYHYRTREEMEELVASVDSGLVLPLSAEGFIRAVMPIFRAMGDAGAGLFPPDALNEAYLHSDPLFPISVAVLDGKLYLNDELKGFESLPPGCELLSINGNSSTKVLEKIRNGLVPEGANETRKDRQIEKDFPVLYRRFVGSQERFLVRYRDVDGTETERMLFAITGDQIKQFHRKGTLSLQPWRLEEFPDTRAAWLTLSTLEPKVLADAQVEPAKYLNTVLDVLRKSECRTLVIDLRGASGTDLAIAEQVFALVAQTPYRLVSSMSINSGQVPDAYADAAPDFFTTVGDLYLPEQNGRRMLRPEDPRLMHLLPMAKAFSGKLYVICDGGTVGAGAAAAMLAKRSGRARLVGEEAGSNAASFCGGRTLDIALPATGCHLVLPLTRYVPNGVGEGPKDHGEIPTYPVYRVPDDVAKGKDTVRDMLMLLIDAMK